MFEQKKIVHVAVAVIRRAEQILIAKRPEHVHQGGLWEFPGGKVEVGETLPQALSRELKEELGIDVDETGLSPLIAIEHDYGDKQVMLDVWYVDRFVGEPQGCEGQPLRWVAPLELAHYDFPLANRRIINVISLPERYLITGRADNDAQFERRLISSLQNHHVGMVLYRDAQGVEVTAETLVTESAVYSRLMTAKALCAETSVPLLISGRPEWLSYVDVDGVQLPARIAAEFSERPVPENKLLGVSCHHSGELSHALRIGADFVTLSPVLATRSHPDQPAKGWPWFADLAKIQLPVYALGGLNENALAQSKACGGVGVAAISAWWPDIV